MSLDKALKVLKYDKRLMEIYLNKGLVTKEEIKKHLEELPDLGKNVDLLNLEKGDKESNEQH